MLRPTAIAAAALMAACGQARAEPPAATPTSVTTVIEVTTPTAIEVSTTALLRSQRRPALPRRKRRAVGSSSMQWAT